jgi:hypothetical protein
MNNGQPGVAFHSHTTSQFLNDNVIVGNQISGNGADNGDAATPGPPGIDVFGVSPITGTIISQNAIQQEAFEVVVNMPTPGGCASQQLPRLHRGRGQPRRRDQQCRRKLVGIPWRSWDVGMCQPDRECSSPRRTGNMNRQAR